MTSDPNSKSQGRLKVSTKAVKKAVHLVELVDCPKTSSRLAQGHIYGAVWPHTIQVKSTCFDFTDRVDVEGVGADEGDGIIQIVVLDPILEVLVGYRGQGQGSHRVLAAICQPHLQADGFAHSTVGNDIAVTWPPVHQHVWKRGGEEKGGGD